MIDDEHEPMSLAEQHNRAGRRLGSAEPEPTDDYDKSKPGEIHVAELQKMTMAELIEEARKENLNDIANAKRQDLIFRILKERIKMTGLMYGEGT
ncbi:MAG: Rho termination factor N-terminal domain-containing protein, partial [Pirellulaceae bacterium]